MPEKLNDDQDRIEEESFHHLISSSVEGSGPKHINNNESLDRNSFDYLNNNKINRGDDIEFENEVIIAEPEPKPKPQKKESSANKQKKLNAIPPPIAEKMQRKISKKQTDQAATTSIISSNQTKISNTKANSQAKSQQARQQLSNKNLKTIPKSESQQKASPNSKISEFDNEPFSKNIPSFKTKLNFKKSEKIVIEAKNKGKSTNFSCKPPPIYQDVNLKREIGSNSNYMSASSNKFDKTTVPDFKKMSFRNTFSNSPDISPHKQKKQTLLSL